MNPEPEYLSSNPVVTRKNKVNDIIQWSEKLLNRKNFENLKHKANQYTEIFIIKYKGGMLTSVTVVISFNQNLSY